MMLAAALLRTGRTIVGAIVFFLPALLAAQDDLLPNPEYAAFAEEADSSSVGEIDGETYDEFAAAMQAEEQDSFFSLAAFQQPGSSAGMSSPGRSGNTSASRQTRFGTAGNQQLAFSRPTYMIADNTGGGCGGLFIRGSLVASILHPTFACSRLNIAENNSPIVQDRVYLSYRHFHNASDISVFPNTPAGGRNSLNIDRFTLGAEKKFTDNFSVELRVPMSSQMSSDLFFAQNANENSTLPLKDYNTNLGNIAAIAKMALYQNETTYVSGGVAVNVPTAPDVTIRGLVDDPNFVIRDNQGRDTGIRVDADLTLDGVVRNQTVNISPFVGYYARHRERWFSQGFAQVDVAANESTASLDMAYSIRFFGFPIAGGRTNEVDRISQQTLLRLNWGAGYWLIDEPDAPYLNQLGAMFEVHYTSTMNNAKLLGPVRVIDGFPQAGIQPIDLVVGNLANRLDTVNLVAGIPMRIGLTTITNGFIVPIRDEPNRGFDFEYNLMLNRNF